MVIGLLLNKDNTYRWERERRYGLDPNHWLLNKTVFQTSLSKLKVCKPYVRHFISGSIYMINTAVQQRELSALCKMTLKTTCLVAQKAVQVIPLGCAPAHIQYYNAEVVYHADANLSIKNMSNCIKKHLNQPNCTLFELKHLHKMKINSFSCNTLFNMSQKNA